MRIPALVKCVHGICSVTRKRRCRCCLNPGLNANWRLGTALCCAGYGRDCRRCGLCPGCSPVRCAQSIQASFCRRIEQKQHFRCRLSFFRFRITANNLLLHSEITLGVILLEINIRKVSQLPERQCRRQVGSDPVKLSDQGVFCPGRLHVASQCGGFEMRRLQDALQSLDLISTAKIIRPPRVGFNDLFQLVEQTGDAGCRAGIKHEFVAS